jgi:transposase
MSGRMNTKKTKRKYTEEFKKNAVQLCMTRSTTVRHLAAELGVTDKILHRWKKELAESQTAGTRFAPGSGKSRDEEVENLRRENKRLKDDVEILKKAAAYFAQHAR